jgi:ribosomal protein L11 methyltransferase
VAGSTGRDTLLSGAAVAHGPNASGTIAARDQPRHGVWNGLACTQLCLEALEGYVRPGDSVLDVGSGSGILSVAASLLGAKRVCGCDIDYDAVETARERVPCPAFVGSVDAIRGGSMDVIVSNISSAAIEGLAGEFARVRKPRSTLILSGFPEWDPVEAFEVKRTTQKGEWLCVVC